MRCLKRAVSAEIFRFDSSNNVLGSNIGSANTDGTTGSNSLLSVSFPGTSYVTLGNTGLADEYAFDDLAFTPQSQRFLSRAPGRCCSPSWQLWVR
jgi:hypothetical protein